MTQQDFDLVSISLGAGVQSSTMYLMSVVGALPKADIAIFADPQAESQHTYAYLDYLEEIGGKVVPIKRATAGSLTNAIERSADPDDTSRFASVPFWAKGKDGREAPGLRQCTMDYKVTVVRNAIRSELGLSKGQRAKGRFRVEEWIGISLDEAQRAKPARPEYNWITYRWPLLYDVPMHRQQCKNWLKENGFKEPPKSACSYCPWRTIEEYRALKVSDPEGYAEAVRVDTLIRAKGPIRGMRELQYVHRSLRPLDEAVEAESIEDGQLDLFGNECEGMCGV